MPDDFKLPRAVQAQADKAEQELEALRNQQQEPPSEPQQGDKPEAVQDPPRQEPEKDPWQAKYEVLKGKFDSEVPELQKQLRRAQEDLQAQHGLSDQVDNLRAELEQLRSERDALKRSGDLDSRFSDLQEAYGEDLIAVLKDITKAKNESDAANQRLRQELQQLRDSVTQLTSSTQDVSQRSFMSMLSTHLQIPVTEVDRINRDPKFLEWLQQPDGLSRRTTRHKSLQESEQDGDVEGVAAYFSAWLKEQKGSSGETRSPEKQAQLDKMVVPDTRSGPEGETTSQKRIWTPEEIQREVDAMVKHPSRFTDEQVKALERELLAAQAEGRVRAGPQTPQAQFVR